MKTAKELVLSHPGVFDRRQAIIVALCQGCDTANFSIAGESSEAIGQHIVKMANKIIEETEQ